MEENPKADALARAVRALSLGVGCLALVSLVQAGIYAYSVYRSALYFRGVPSSSTATKRGGGHLTGASEIQSDGPSFDRLTPEEQIKRATAILVTKHEVTNGKPKAVVVEILKQPPDGSLGYAVGDEVPLLSSRYGVDTATYGDGDVVFFAGSSNDMRESVSYRNGRIGGFGEMPLTTLRELVSGKPGRSAALPGPSSSSGAPSNAPAPSSQREDLVLETSTNGEGVTREFTISRSAALHIPEWLPEKGEPPLAMSKAVRLAAAAVQTEGPEHSPHAVRSLRMGMVSCDEPVGNRWYYVLDCVPRQSGGLAMTRSVPVVVLMDGSVVLGKIRK